MKRHTLYGFAALLVGMLLAMACYDKDNTIHPIPDLVIENIPGGNIGAGEMLELTPVATMGGSEVECTYQWFIYRDTVATLISEENTLQYRVDTTGTITFNVEATHVETGIQSVLTFYYTVVPRINHGWLILKETADGNTDMDMQLIQGGDTIEFAEDQLSLALGAPMQGRPVSLLWTAGTYKYVNPETGIEEDAQTCLVPVSQKDILMYRVADEKVLATSDELFYEVPDFSTSKIEAFMYQASTSALICDGQVSLLKTRTPTFMPPLLGDYHLAPYLVCWGYANKFVVYDDKNCSFGVIYPSGTFSTTMEIKYFPDTYREADDLRISPNNMNADMLYFGQTDGSVDPEMQTNNGTLYALMQKRDDAAYVWLYGLNNYEMASATYGPIRFAREIPVSRCPEFAEADFYTMHQTHNIMYFIKDNVLSYYDIDRDEFVMDVYSFSGEVTYCKFINNTYAYNTASWLGDMYDYRFTYLVVATSSGDEYTVNCFDVVLDNLTLLPEKTITGTGKVRFMSWFAPSFEYSNDVYIYS